MAATGSHPAVKLKKHIQFPSDSNSGRRPSNPPSNPSESTSTLAVDAPSFNSSRRRSTRINAPGLLTTALSVRRMTRTSIQYAEQVPKPTVKYENTYKMGPDEGTHFVPSKAKCEIESLLESKLDSAKYDPSGAANLTESIAEGVKNVVKNLNIPRYKLVSSVVVGECKGQGMETASRCLWDDSKDNYTAVTHKNKSMFAVVTIFAVYYE